MPEVQIRVRDDATNEAVSKADIGLFVRVNHHDGYSLIRGTTDEAGVGHFQLGDKAEIFTVVRCRGYQEWRDFVIEMNKQLSPRMVHPGDPTCFDVQLKSGVTIEGRVVDTQGHPIEGVKIGLVLSGPNWCSWPYSFGMSDSAHWPPRCKTDDKGEFEWLSFRVERATEREARWVLTLEHPNYVPAMVQKLERRIAAGERICQINATLATGFELQGKVLRRDGQPVPKAKIKTTANPNADQPVCVRFSKEATTTESGEFAIHGLEGCNHSVDVEASGFAPFSTEVNLNNNSTMPDAILDAGSVLEGRLQNEDGVLKNARLFAHTEDRKTWREAQTDNEGRFRLEGLPTEGKVVLTVSGKLERTISLPSEFVEINIRNAKTATVNVVDASTGEFLQPPGRLSIFGPGFSAVRPIETAGPFKLENKPCGQYKLIANFPDRPATEIEVELSDSEERGFEIRVPVGATRRGVVKDKAGNPLAGVVITLHGRGRSDRKSTTTTEDGSFSLTGLNDRYWAVFSQKGFAVKAIGMAAEKTELLEIVMIQGATIAGQVRSPDGKPVSGILVKVAPKNSKIVPFSLPSGLTDSDGRYELTKVPEGKYVLIFGKETHDIEVVDGDVVKSDLQTAASI